MQENCRDHEILDTEENTRRVTHSKMLRDIFKFTGRHEKLGRRSRAGGPPGPVGSARRRPPGIGARAVTAGHGCRRGSSEWWADSGPDSAPGFGRAPARRWPPEAARPAVTGPVGGTTTRRTTFAVGLSDYYNHRPAEAPAARRQLDLRSAGPARKSVPTFWLNINVV
jgi:hypothetical protein